MAAMYVTAVLSMAGRYLDVSSEATKVLGWTPEALLASPGPDIHVVEDSPIVADAYLALLDGAPSVRLVARLRDQLGRQRWIESRIRRHQDPGTATQQLLVTARAVVPPADGQAYFERV